MLGYANILSAILKKKKNKILDAFFLFVKNMFKYKRYIYLKYMYISYQHWSDI